MKRNLIILVVALFSLQMNAQGLGEEKPKLVVGIVVDQMRYDYLTRFWERYSEGGFKRLINEGFNFRNNHFNYIPTYTGPGHSSVWTGTSPMNHGIIGNNWFDKFTGETVYCAGDNSVTPVGTESKAGKMSPHRMKTTSVADQNRLHTQMRGKTIGVALKDRGSILPAGHTANAAYWFHGEDEGKWITSSYYLKELPKWVQKFNNSNKAESYFKEWNTLYDIETYKESGPDVTEFEGGFKGKKEASFPYDLKKLKDQNKGFDLLKTVAYGIDFTTDFALAAIDGEDLGEDEDTDFLTLSYSSTDYIGHNFGVNSKEIQDVYLRLDLSLERLLNELDVKVGEGNYTVFLTADHGAVDVPSYLKSVGIPAGNFNTGAFVKEVKEFVEQESSHDDLIRNVSNNQVFFDYDKLKEADVDAQELEDKIAHFMLQQENIEKVYTRSQLNETGYLSGIAAALQNGFHQVRSGDVLYVLDPAYIPSKSLTGTTHGSGFMYDTHAPLLFFGNGIKHGSTTKRSEIVDIAPTVAALLGISFPNGTSGKPLYSMLDM